jgi:hypothetical protein
MRKARVMRRANGTCYVVLVTAATVSQRYHRRHDLPSDDGQRGWDRGLRRCTRQWVLDR